MRRFLERLYAASGAAAALCLAGIAAVMLAQAAMRELGFLLRGSDDILDACKKRGMAKGHTTPDGMWTLTEVECMGNCASAPMVQINDANYEDLTPERLDHVLDELAAGRMPKTGTQDPARHTVEPVGGPTTLKEMVTENHDYRGEW